MKIPVGLKGSAEETVTAECTALAVGSGTMPVYATPCMAALMEKASYTSLLPYLDEEKTSVGTRLDISHVMSTPQGQHVSAQSEVVMSEGNRIVFKVTAADGAGTIGEGIHERVIVTAESFMSRSEKRAAGEAGKK